MIIQYLRTGFLFIVGVMCTWALFYVAGLYAQHLINNDPYGSIINSLGGAAFVTFIPIMAHLAIVGNKACVKDHELTSRSIFLNFGLFWFVVTFLVTLLIRSDFLISYYSLTTVFLAIWTFFGITQMIATLDFDKEDYKEMYNRMIFDDDEVE